MRLPFDLGALWARALAWYHGYSQRDRRIILGVVGLTATSLLYLGIVTPILDFRRSIEQQIADGQEELERAMRFLAAKDTLGAEREDLRKRLGQAKARLLPGGTGTLGAAALQERANAIAAERGVTLQSTQVMKDEAMDPFRKVSVRLTLSGELKPLAELVSGLEYERQLGIPFVEVSRRGAVAGAKGPRNLSVTLEVTGFVQGGAKGDGAGKAEGVEGDAAPQADQGAEAAQSDGEGGAADVASAPAALTTSTTTALPSAAATTPPTALPPAGAATSPMPRRVPVVPGSTLPAGAPVAGAPTTSTIVVVPSTIVPMTFPTLVVPTPTLPHAGPSGQPHDAADPMHHGGPPEMVHPPEPAGPEAIDPAAPIEEKVDDEEEAE